MRARNVAFGRLQNGLKYSIIDIIIAKFFLFMHVERDEKAHKCCCR